VPAAVPAVPDPAARSSAAPGPATPAVTADRNPSADDTGAAVPCPPADDLAAVVMTGAVLRAESGAPILGPVDWCVGRGERWVVLGANGSGKTSLLRLAGAERRPTAGRVVVLGHRLGAVDMRWLRSLIGVASAAVSDQLRPTSVAHDVVLTAKHGALEPWWHDYDDGDHLRADELLDFMGCAAFAQRMFATLSQGERQRVLLARALMAEPQLLLLDEPAAGLDLPARELLVSRLSALFGDLAAPTIVLVTHHVEEIPPGVTHALLLRSGLAVAAGPIETVLREETMSAAYGIDITLEHREGRWAAWGRLRDER
jgi:iron complex transport system ATP-binding protein